MFSRFFLLLLLPYTKEITVWVAGANTVSEDTIYRSRGGNRGRKLGLPQKQVFSQKLRTFLVCVAYQTGLHFTSA